MPARFAGAIVAALARCGTVDAADASFHCVVTSAYEVDRGQQSPNTMMREKARVDVSIYNGKALVHHDLHGFANATTAAEFTILQEGGKNSSWALVRTSKSSMFPDFTRSRTILIHIRTYDLKVGDPAVPFYLDYEGEIMLGTCDRIAGEVGYENEK
jgi:hypothetical protein